MNKLLIIKHWEFFICIIGLPYLIGCLFSIFSDSNNLGNENIVFSILWLYELILLCSWMYIVGINLHAKIPSSIFLNIRKFKALLIFSFSYFLTLLIGLLFIELIGNGTNSGLVDIIAFILAIIPFLCLLYCFYFIAKGLKIIENQEDVVFKDFVSNYLSMLYLPIGIWFIQPKINDIFKKEDY
jgi:hypothetical protein